MKKRYAVQNGTVQAEFSKASIDKMKMLGLIQFRTGRRTADGYVFIYTASFDSRRPL